MDYLFDTNIFIYYLNESNEVDKYFNHEFLLNNKVYISSITRIELLSFPELTDDEKNKIELFLKEFELIQLTTTIQDLCIDIRKQRKIKLPDAIILACALETDSILITNDTKLLNIFNSIKIS